VAGALFAIPDPLGWYPALLPGDEAVHGGLVHGSLHAPGPDFAAQDLAAIDAFEDFDPADPAASLYCRLALPVSLADGGTALAQVYRYNRPLPSDALAIAGGDFAAFARARGLPVFGEVGEGN
jgi:gamma-glutamylcyclotransferase (GGCT)/AIG2-like uncharacterized protein YtfP